MKFTFYHDYKLEWVTVPVEQVPELLLTNPDEWHARQQSRWERDNEAWDLD